MDNYLLNKTLNVKYNIDVLVIGGGTAGTFAAISAAKNGASVLLVEKNGILGGTMTVSGVNFPGLFFAWGKQIISGPCWESIERTVALGGAQMPRITQKPQYHWLEQIRLNKSVYSHVLDEMCKESAVKVLFHSMLSHIEENECGVWAVLTGKDGMFAVKAKCVIDATGDANVTAMLQYPFSISQVQQPATLINAISGYDFETLDLKYIKEYIDGAVSRGEFFSELNGDTVINFLKRNILDIHISCHDAASSESKSELEAEARKKLVMITAFLRDLCGLEHLYVSEVCNECGVRETRRIVGETVVTAEDYIEANFYDDSVCYAFYPIDLHIMQGIKQHFLEEGRVAKIPYRALVPKGSKRVLAAGRILSSDQDANSALRVEAVCMATGQVAGCAAAIMAKNDINALSVNYGELCADLRKLGAIVPQR